MAYCRRGVTLLILTEVKMKELNILQMEEIEGGGFWGCLGVGLTLIGIGLSGPIGWAATGVIAAAGVAAAIDTCHN